jgi:hypothetical protein
MPLENAKGLFLNETAPFVRGEAERRVKNAGPMTAHRLSIFQQSLKTTTRALHSKLYSTLNL